MRKRIGYGIVTMILLAVEVFIALFVHDSFIRPYVGDVLVVIVIYSFIRILIPQRCKLLPLWIFLFAAGWEVLQLFHMVDLLGLGESRFFRILIGSVFDWKDIVCYAVGCLLLAVYEMILAAPIEERFNRISNISFVISVAALVTGSAFHGYRMHPENETNYQLGVTMGIVMISIFAITLGVGIVCRILRKKGR